MTTQITIKTNQQGFYLMTTTFLASLALLLLTVVDIRRGFLFSSYVKVGAPATLLNLNLYQLPLLLLGGLGAWLSYQYLKGLETGFKEPSPNLRRLTKVLAIIIGTLLVIDLFIYRGVPASRFIAAGTMKVGTGTMGISQAVPVASFPEWLQPLGEGINYLLLVWHATLLGIFLGGLFLVVGAGLLPRLKNNSFGSHLTGSAMALLQPFCSCCAAPIASSLYRRGAALGPTLAFMVSAPMLNITGLILAAALLPTKFAILRIVGGIIVGIFLTYATSLITLKWVARDEAEVRPAGKIVTFFARGLNAYNRLFQFGRLYAEEVPDSPVSLISNWLSMSWRLGRVVVPILLVGATISVLIVKALPDSGNSVVGVTLTALFGTIIMIPTWTEIPLAAQLVKEGLTGIAATVLITLPAVSLPCLAIVAGAIRSLRAVAILGVFIFVAGIIAGIIFL